MDGPVVAAAKLALERGDVTPALKWVKLEDEKVIRELFAKVLSARTAGAEARELADRFFFESLVRLHRAGEGAAYSGLQPQGTPIEPAISLADQAIAAGDAATLTKAMTQAVDAGIRERFTRVIAAKKRADESVAAGREFVQAYVELTHYVERLHGEAPGTERHSEGAAAVEHKH